MEPVKINWRLKLSSRKLWAMLASLVISALVLFGVNSTVATEVGALVLAVGSVIAYIAGESYIDGKRVESQSITDIVENGLLDMSPEDPTTPPEL